MRVSLRLLAIFSAYVYWIQFPETRVGNRNRGEVIVRRQVCASLTMPSSSFKEEHILVCLRVLRRSDMAHGFPLHDLLSSCCDCHNI